MNDNFRLLPATYLFTEVARKVSDFRKSNPEAEIIRMDIGDVTRPVCGAVIEAMRRAVDDMGSTDRFHGYGPEQGYSFLREAIARGDYRERGIEIADDEIFISDGAKSDLANLSDLFAPDARVAVTDPVYPVYVDSNVIAGRAGELVDGRWSRIIYLDCTADNGFIPALPSERPDVIYLCFPNNPTGEGITAAQLRPWVEYALREKCLIIYDSAYEAFVRTPWGVRSIYEIEGARRVAIECRSFSKTAGFTGLRCGYTVVPKTLDCRYPGGEPCDVNALWNRRQSTKFNGASYIVQRGAEALYTTDARKQTAADIAYYHDNATLMREELTRIGFAVSGGIDSPYIWLQSPDSLTSWQFFSRLLELCGVTSTPGSGFGRCGEGFLRLTAFNTREETEKALCIIAQKF